MQLKFHLICPFFSDNNDTPFFVLLHNPLLSEVFLFSIIGLLFEIRHLAVDSLSY